MEEYGYFMVMRFINILWLGGLALASPPPEPLPSTDHARVSSRLIALRQGRWLTPRGFVQRTMYMRNGRLYQRPIGRVDSVVDLAGRYVVPPLADAHNHTADQRYGLPLAIQQYLREGVFYLKNPNSLPAMTAQVRYTLPQDGPVRIALHDMIGREVALLSEGLQTSGDHELDWTPAPMCCAWWARAWPNRSPHA